MGFGKSSSRWRFAYWAPSLWMIRRSTRKMSPTLRIFGQRNNVNLSMSNLVLDIQHSTPRSGFEFILYFNSTWRQTPSIALPCWNSDLGKCLRFDRYLLLLYRPQKWDTLSVLLLVIKFECHSEIGTMAIPLREGSHSRTTAYCQEFYLSWQKVQF